MYQNRTAEHMKLNVGLLRGTSQMAEDLRNKYKEKVQIRLEELLPRYQEVKTTPEKE